jgi:O-antigen ligase
MQLSKNNSIIFIINFWLIVFSLSIFRLPIALGYRFNLPFVYLGVIPNIAGIVFNILVIIKQKRQVFLNKRGFGFLCVFTTLWIIALIRTSTQSISVDSFFILGALISWILMGLFIFLAFYVMDERQQKSLNNSLIYSLGVFVFLNLAFYFIGINPPNSLYLSDYPSQMLSVIGITTYRVLFPMASGINSFGTLSGAVIVGSFFVFLKTTNSLKKVFLSLTLISCLIAILLTDSRGALVFSFFTIGLCLLPKSVFRYARWIPFLISVFSLFIVFIPPDFSANWLPNLTRPASDWESTARVEADSQCENALANSNGFFSNRSIIWRFAMDDLRQFKLQQVIGYGFRGPIFSGMNSSYACLFKSYAYPEFASLHQIWLQLVFDIGYFGLLITVVLLVFMVLGLSDFKSPSKSKDNYVFISILCYIVLTGTLEATITPDAIGLFFVLTFLVISGSFSNKKLVSNMDSH